MCQDFVYPVRLISQNDSKINMVLQLAKIQCGTLLDKNTINTHWKLQHAILFFLLHFALLCFFPTGNTDNWHTHLKHFLQTAGIWKETFPSKMTGFCHTIREGCLNKNYIWHGQEIYVFLARCHESMFVSKSKVNNVLL